jgi:hypothetical protein
MKADVARRIKKARAQVIEMKPRGNFLDCTRETIFHRWLHHDQEELYLADQYEVRRREIEEAIKAEVRRRLKFPPLFPPSRRAA